MVGFQIPTVLHWNTATMMKVRRWKFLRKMTFHVFIYIFLSLGCWLQWRTNIRRIHKVLGIRRCWRSCLRRTWRWEAPRRALKCFNSTFDRTLGLSNIFKHPSIFELINDSTETGKCSKLYHRNELWKGHSRKPEPLRP